MMATTTKRPYHAAMPHNGGDRMNQCPPGMAAAHSMHLVKNNATAKAA